ncbi:DeoR/GlpR family DNA-binding transcription regulator [Xylocopilactobacillus apicola]|uniref:DeoR family transcriptional regulator n=1 Tax=Xylocopilactobacillus apicola TaxID=2932184 RepID=A0AAU9DH42_9LACO|nr:DeoR/GlpR family DNA-binding transcription regulator [Xylocopilactobacillus apicola]BDR59295.1 DeoR family transcriptional regulator [Xylocopilactobacillus apicola]
MDATARRAAIVNILKKNNFIKILELSKSLNVTRETVRRDLYSLEKKGIVRTVRGGAVLNVAMNETDYDRRAQENIKEKHVIAKAFVDFVSEGDTIYLDYGTTSLAVAKILKHFSELTIVTNSIPIINELYKVSGIEVIVLGGIVRKNEGALYGNSAISAVQDMVINVGFFSGSGITPEYGLTNHHSGEAELARDIIKRCQKKIIGVDHHKFGKAFLNKVMKISEMDVLITENISDEQIIHDLQLNTDLIIASS